MGSADDVAGCAGAGGGAPEGAWEPERVASGMLETPADGLFLQQHLEDRGVTPANHLLGNLVGLWVLGQRFSGSPVARQFSRTARV